MYGSSYIAMAEELSLLAANMPYCYLHIACSPSRVLTGRENTRYPNRHEDYLSYVPGSVLGTMYR